MPEEIYLDRMKYAMDRHVLSQESCFASLKQGRRRRCRIALVKVTAGKKEGKDYSTVTLLAKFRG